MDIAAANWNEDDASNSTAAPDGAGEGMAPSGVNNVLRAMMGAIKRWFNQQSPKATGGTGTAFTLSYSVTPGALIGGMTHVVEFHVANGAAATLNVNALGAIPLHYYSAGAWRTIPPVLLGPAEICRVAYHASSGAYRILGREDSTGDVIATARANARSGALLAFGQAISRTDYAGLFVAISTTYGVGDGSTTFNLPDLRSYAVAGKSDMGGSNNGLLTGGTVLGAALGAQTHTHPNSGGVNGTIPALPVSITSDAPSTEQPGVAGGGGLTVGAGGHTHFVNGFTGASGIPGSWTLNGSTAAGSSVQPTRILNYLICL